MTIISKTTITVIPDPSSHESIASQLAAKITHLQSLPNYAHMTAKNKLAQSLGAVIKFGYSEDGTQYYKTEYFPSQQVFDNFKKEFTSNSTLFQNIAKHTSDMTSLGLHIVKTVETTTDPMPS